MIETTFVLQRVGKKVFHVGETTIISSTKSLDRLDEKQIIQVIMENMGFTPISKDSEIGKVYTDKTDLVEIFVHERNM